MMNTTETLLCIDCGHAPTEHFCDDENDGCTGAVNGEIACECVTPRYRDATDSEISANAEAARVAMAAFDREMRDYMVADDDAREAARAKRDAEDEAEERELLLAECA